MTNDLPPDAIAVPVSQLAKLATEWWRVNQAIASLPTAPAGARHGLRRMEDVLTRLQIQIVSMVGRDFDPGLPLRVIDAVEDSSLPAEKAVVSEMISPVVLHQGEVIQSGDVILRQGRK